MKSFGSIGELTKQRGWNQVIYFGDWIYKQYLQHPSGIVYRLLYTIQHKVAPYSLISLKKANENSIHVLCFSRTKTTLNRFLNSSFRSYIMLDYFHTAMKSNKWLLFRKSLVKLVPENIGHRHWCKLVIYEWNNYYLRFILGWVKNV